MTVEGDRSCWIPDSYTSIEYYGLSVADQPLTHLVHSCTT